MAKSTKKKGTKKKEPPVIVNLTFEQALKKSITTKLPKKKK